MVQPIFVGQINLRNALGGSEQLQQIMDAVPEIYSTLEATREVAVAAAALADIQEKADLVFQSMQGIQKAVEALIDALVNTFDISYHQLSLTDTPIAGGLSSYINVFNANLKNTSDDNRPYDEGGAAMVTIMLVVNHQNMYQAMRAAQDIKAMFIQAETARKDALKALLGVTDYEDLKQEFWGHYIKKQMAGTHATVPGDWQKYSIGDLMPNITQPLNDWLAGLEGKWVGETNAYLLSVRLRAMFDKMLAFIGNIVTIIDAWKKLLLDTSITIIVTPIITGSVDNGVTNTAHDNLAVYMTTVSEQIRAGSFVNITGGLTGTDYSAMVRQDNYCAGVNLVFKAPSVEVAAQQIGAVCKLWGLGGVSLGIESEANQYAAQNIG